MKRYLFVLTLLAFLGLHVWGTQEDCDRDLGPMPTSFYLKLIERAAERRLLSPTQIRETAQRRAPTNPLANFGLHANDLPFSQGLERYTLDELTRATWPK